MNILLWSIDFTSWMLVISASALYALVVTWFTRKYGQSFDERFRIVAAMAAAYLAIVGAWRYLDQRQREVENDFNKTSFQYCDEAVAATAAISTAYKLKIIGGNIDSVALSAARTKFLDHYIGSLAIVEDDGVARAMDEFNSEAERDRWGLPLAAAVPPNTQALNDYSAAYSRLSNRSLSLATACRQMVKSSWNVSVVPQTTKDRLEKANIPLP